MPKHKFNPTRSFLTIILLLGLVTSPFSGLQARAANRDNSTNRPTAGLEQPSAALLASLGAADGHRSAVPEGVFPQTLTVQTPITATVQYTITDLGTLAGSFSTYAYGVNSNGQVVGRDYNANGVTSPFLWQDGGMIDLGGLGFAGSNPEENPLGGVNNEAHGINTNGQVVGQSQVSSGDSHAFLWQSGVMADLGTLGGNSSYAFAVNASGQVVGHTQNSDGEARAFLWQNGSMSDLGDLGGPVSFAQALDLNDAGVVVGSSVNASGQNHAAMWDGINIIDLGTMCGGAASSAVAINNHLQVVGTSLIPQIGVHAFLWQNGSMIDLAPLEGYNQANDINDLGQVVGSGSSGAFLWQDDNGNGQSDPGEKRDLSTLIPPNSGWNLTAANAVNNSGQIAGYGTHNGQTRAYLLTPNNQWTLMFYLDGDNDLGGSYFSIFNHLESVADTPGVNILVLWDSLAFNDSGYYKVQYDTNPGAYSNYTEGVNYWSQGEVPMDLSATLSDFITWGIQNYPAEHYALTLDDHGSGLGGGLCDGSGTYACLSTMNLAEMKLALATAYDATGEKLDVLYMAMCLMGMIEDGYQFRDYVDFYVASEHLQYVYTDYLPDLDAGLTLDWLAQLLAANYATEMIAEGKPYTVSAADLTQLPALVTATDGLADSLLAHIDAITPTLSTIATLVQRYDNEAPAGIDTADTYADLYDLADLVAQNLSGYPDIVAAAQAVMSAVDAYILYESHASTASTNLDHSHGVSIFFPADPSSFYYGENNDFAAGTDWGNPRSALQSGEQISWGPLLVEYIAQVNPDGIDDPTPPEPQPKIIASSLVFLPVVAR